MSQPTLTLKHVRTFLLLLASGTLLFNALFWEEKMAANLVLFVVFAIASLLFLYRKAFGSPFAKGLLLAVAASLTMVIVYHSALSCMACIASIILLTAYCKYQHRSPLYAIASAMEAFVRFIPQFFTYLRLYFSQKREGKKGIGKIRFAIVPLLIMFVFLFIYFQSSKAFANIFTQFFEQLYTWVQPVLDWIEPARLLFLGLGLLLTGGLLYRYYQPAFLEAEVGKTDELKRNKVRRKYPQTNFWQDCMQFFIGRHAGSNMALKYEYKAGLLSLVILNILLLFVNLTDVAYLWMGREYAAGFEWADYVHEGAEMLVLSILLAMLVVLFFFRGNLNFFSQKKSLQRTAYIWLLQNGFLAASVCLRNYNYIVHMALAYKRIGLFVFALLVFVGLISVFLKISRVKSSYYLVKFNALAALVVMVVSTFVQWDVWIAKYNLAHKNESPVDVGFLLSLSDHALPVLQQNRAFISSQPILQRDRYDRYGEAEPSASILDRRIAYFLEQQQKYTWLSWNLADAQTEKELRQSLQFADKR